MVVMHGCAYDNTWDTRCPCQEYFLYQQLSKKETFLTTDRQFTVIGTCGLRVIGCNERMNLLPRQYMIHVKWIKIFTQI